MLKLHIGDQFIMLMKIVVTTLCAKIFTSVSKSAEDPLKSKHKTTILANKKAPGNSVTSGSLLW